MKNLNIILSIATLIILLFTFYFIFSVSRTSVELKKTINEVKEDISTSKNSVKKAQDELIILIEKLKFAEKELNILRVERELIALKEKKKTAANWEELGKLKLKILEKENERKKLLKEAETFEL